MNPLVMIILGLCVGILSGLSGLGGGFIMVPLLLFLGFAAERAVGTSFMVILIISTSALLAHGKMNHVDYRLGIFLGLGGIIGAQIGSRLMQYIPTATFKQAFAVILVLLAIRMFFQK